MPREIGSRVGAIRNGEGDNVYFFGFGTYQGYSIPPEDVGGFNLGLPTPEIKLDSGVSVYGCECWWASEEKIKKMIDGKNVVMVEPDR